MSWNYDSWNYDSWKYDSWNYDSEITTVDITTAEITTVKTVKCCCNEPVDSTKWHWSDDHFDLLPKLFNIKKSFRLKVLIIK